MPAKPVAACWRPLLALVVALVLMGASKSCVEADLGATLHFEVDSVALGQPFTAVGSLRYADGFDYFPPDTPKAYAPFELIRVDTLARGVVIDTVFDDTNPSRFIRIRADSLRWHLRTFSIDSIQRLRLIYTLLDTTGGKRDTVRMTTSEDSVFFAARWARPLPPSAQPQFDFTLTEVEQPFDWPGLLLVLSVLALVGGLLTWMLWRPVHRWLARRSLDLAHAAQLAQLAQLEAQLPEVNALVGINSLWERQFAEEIATAANGARLEAMTTAELETLLPNSALANWAPALLQLHRAQDSLAYGGYPMANPTLSTAVGELRTLLTEDYTRRRRALR